MPEIFSAKDKKEAKATIKDVVVLEAKKMREELGKGGMFSAVSVLPDDVSFEAQSDEEKIILLLRRHVITNLKWMMIASLSMFLPLFWGDFPLVSAVDSKTQFALVVLWYLGLGFYVLENILMWFFNVFIVTDERVIDVDFYNLFYKNVDVTQIKNIEEVNYTQAGVLTSVFNYGDVVVQTASEQRIVNRQEESAAFTFESVPNPDRVTKVISQLMEQEELEAIEGRVR